MSALSNTWSSIPGPQDISRSITRNGIVVLSRQNFASPSVVISGYFGCGGMFDPEDRLGLALFTSQSLMRGTTKTSEQEIYERLESAGASLGFSVSAHTSSFGGRALVEDLPLLLGTLEECLRFPKFPEKELQQLRAQMLTSLAIRDQDTEQMASIAFEGLVFDGHPYSRPEDGYVQTVSAITRQDIQNFHHKHYGPRGMVISIVGAVPTEQVLLEVERIFGDWENPVQVSEIDTPNFKPLANTQRKHISLEEKYQTDLVLGTLAPSRQSDDFLPLALGNHILGQFGMMGRIGESVRERAGLAYYAGSSMNAGILGGSWEVSAGVNPENVDQAVDLIKKELSRFVNEAVSQEEISESTSNLIGQLPLSMESNSGVASALLRLERYDLGLDYFQRYPALLQSIQAEQILDAARRYLDVERLAIVSAGP